MRVLTVLIGLCAAALLVYYVDNAVWLLRV